MPFRVATTAALAFLLVTGCAAFSAREATVEPSDSIGIINGFLLATAAEARAMAFEEIPLPADVPSVEWKNMDPVKLATLESILTGVPYDEVMDQGGMDAIYVGGQDGPFAFGVRTDLRDALAATPSDKLHDVSAAWLQTEEWQMQYGGKVRESDIAEVASLLGEVVTLAARARDTGANLYILATL